MLAYKLTQVVLWCSGAKYNLKIKKIASQRLFSLVARPMIVIPDLHWQVARKKAPMRLQQELKKPHCCGLKYFCSLVVNAALTQTDFFCQTCHLLINFNWQAFVCSHECGCQMSLLKYMQWNCKIVNCKSLEASTITVRPIRATTPCLN